MASLVQHSDTLEVPSTGGREPEVLSRLVLAEILEPRMEEIFTLVQAELVRSGYDELLTGGIVLTGGTVLLDGSSELAEQVFNLPVRVGRPADIGGLVDVVNSPDFATGVGLVLYGAREGQGSSLKLDEDNIFMRMKNQVTSWFSEYF